MQLSDFHIRQVAFEVKFDPMYRLWDVSGALFQQLSRIWPHTSEGKIDPNHLQLMSDTINVIFGLRTCSIRIARPKSVIQFADQIAQSLDALFLVLEIETLRRVGTRTIYAKSYPTPEAAREAAVELGFIRAPSSPIFNHKSGLAEAESRMVWRDAAMQTQVVMKTEHQSFEVSGFTEFDNVPRKSESHALILDVDRGTLADVERSKFRVRDWLQGVQHVLNRDINRLLAPSEAQL